MTAGGKAYEQVLDLSSWLQVHPEASIIPDPAILLLRNELDLQ